MQQQLAAYSLKEFKKKNQLSIQVLSQSQESGKEDVNGVDMQILKGKHLFFLEGRYYTSYMHICYLFVLLIVSLVWRGDIGRVK